ncbi:Uncharacterized protein Fot_17954 [Forsythia ovata]|uniref:Uncharacterized protein n=1 Tax=Forsythia ovata TaxID=205694 RepID=A0ABD1VGX1_9LAMI
MVFSAIIPPRLKLLLLWNPILPSPPLSVDLEEVGRGYCRTSNLANIFWLPPPSIFSGGNEHEAHRLPGVDELQGAVVVKELITVWVGPRHVLEELEVDDPVRGRECRELHSFDSNYR